MAGFDSRSGFVFGDVVLAPYMMSGQQTAEHRPCVVISSSTYNLHRSELLVMSIAFQDRPNASSGEMSVLDAEGAGLEKGAAFIPVLATIKQNQVRLILGHLNEHDHDRLRHLLGLVIDQ